MPVQHLLADDPTTGAILENPGDNSGNGCETPWPYEAAGEGRVRVSGPLDRMPATGSLVFFWLTDFDTGGRRAPAIAVNRVGISLWRISRSTMKSAWG